MKKVTKFRAVICVCLIVWMTVIFLFSAQNGSQSSETSGNVVKVLINLFYPSFDNLPLSQQTDTLNIITVFVRKAAHFSVYFVLGVLSALLALTFARLQFLIRSLSAFAFCAVYAVTDEIHQHFVVGRACSFKDVCIDSLGALLAISLLTVLAYKKFVKRKNKCEKKI